MIETISTFLEQLVGLVQAGINGLVNAIANLFGTGE